MWHLFLVTLLILAACLLFLSVRLFAGRRFVSTHVEGNKALRRRGITCAQSQDAAAQRGKTRGVRERA